MKTGKFYLNNPVVLFRSYVFYLILFIITTVLLVTGCDPNDDPDKPIVTVDSLGISISELQFTAEKDASLIVVRTNTTWTATKTADWISLSASSGDKNTGFLIGASDNEGFERETIITINAGKETKEIKVNQAGASRIKLTVKDVTFNLLLVEGGQFTMGTDDYSISSLPHQVKLGDFYIAETEVTNALWFAVRNSLPYTNNNETDKPDWPVSETTWNAINNDFIPALNQLTGKTFRLPTEAEWEYAAMGGKLSSNFKYAGSNTLEEVAWYRSNSGGTKQNVKEKEPNQLGLYDMSGNVSEWCGDWYDQYFGFEIINQTIVVPDLQTNPTGASSGTQKVVRGGSIENDEQWGFSVCNIKYRSGINPTGYDIQPGGTQTTYQIKNTGFRLVIAL